MNQPIQTNELKGVYPALMTSMHESGEIDFRKLHMLIDDLIAAGVDGILACGTTGQSATLSHEEHIDLVAHVYNYVNGKCMFMAGAGSNCTREAIELTTKIEERIGPATFLHVTGYYNNPPQEGLIKHYNAITEAMHPESNLIMYNVPGRTKSNIESDTAIELSKNQKIIGIKEASGDLEQVERIIKGTDSDNFRVMSGEDNLVAKIMDMGGYGVISASANIAPKLFVELTRFALEGYIETAYKIQEHVNPLVKAVFCAKNPIPLAHMFDTHLRLPLCRLERVQAQIDTILNRYRSEELGIDLKKYKN